MTITKDKQGSGSEQNQATTSNCPKLYGADGTHTTSDIDITTHAEGVCLGAFDMDLNTRRVHQGVRLQVINSHMGGGIKHRVDCELPSTQKTQKIPSSRQLTTSDDL